MKTPQDLLRQHIAQLQKWDFDILYSIAQAKEPLGYGFSAEGKKHLIEVLFDNVTPTEFDMIVAIDSGWKARFKPGQYLTETVIIKK